MANVLTTNPLIVDTAGSITTTPTKVKAFVYYGATNADDLVLHDAPGGNIILQLKLGTVATSGYNVVIPFPGNGVIFSGIYATTVDTGSYLLIYV